MTPLNLYWSQLISFCQVWKVPAAVWKLELFWKFYHECFYLVAILSQHVVVKPFLPCVVAFRTVHPRPCPPQPSGWLPFVTINFPHCHCESHSPDTCEIEISSTETKWTSGIVNLLLCSGLTYFIISFIFIVHEKRFNSPASIWSDLS